MRFDRGAPLASLELQDDELVTVVALQAVDKEHALAGGAGAARPARRARQG